jgi:hypothetical protein
MFRSTAERRAVYVSFRVDCHRADGITTVPTAVEGVQRGFRLTTSRRREFMDRDPTQLQNEINQLIKKQLDTLGGEIFGGATDAEHREYGQRQRRIAELYGELERLKSAA